MSKRYVAQGTNRRFYIPPTQAADFTEFLDNDIPNTVMDFVKLEDWYDQYDDDYIETVIRGELYPDSTKSRYTNTDHNLNIRCDVRSGIKKGDMLIDENDVIYLLDWDVTLESNNAPSRALMCNMTVNIERYHREITSNDGYLIEPEGYHNIVKDLPCNGYRYEGRPEFTSVSGTPGISPNALRLITMQYNRYTKHITEGDILVWGQERYVVIDIDLVGMHRDGNHGCITLQVRKEPGGNERGE